MKILKVLKFRLASILVLVQLVSGDPALLASDIALANKIYLPKPNTAKTDSNLAPSTSLKSVEFRERFIARGFVLSHDAVNAYIRNQMEKMASARGSDFNYETTRVAGVDVPVIPIHGLLRKTGQFAHIGLGRVRGTPIIYIDTDIYNDADDKRDVLKHESEEIAKWEALRRLLELDPHLKQLSGLDPDKMRSWIRKHMDEPDEDLTGTAYEGLSARIIGKNFHRDSHNIDRLYKKYADRISIDTDYIIKLISMYQDDEVDPAAIIYDPEKSNDLNLGAVNDDETDLDQDDDAPKLFNTTVSNISQKDGSPAEGLSCLYGRKVFKSNPVNAAGFAKMRASSETAASSELEVLAAMHLVGVAESAGQRFYYLAEEPAAGAQPEAEIIRHKPDCASVLIRPGDGGFILGFINYSQYNKDVFRHIPDMASVGRMQMYEVRELYKNNKITAAKDLASYYLSADELANLGMREHLLPWETVMYSIKPVPVKPDSIRALSQSLAHYKVFGVSDRIEHSLVSSLLLDAVNGSDFNKFKDVMLRLLNIVRHRRDMETGTVSTILFDIAMAHPDKKALIIDYLTKMALDDAAGVDMSFRYDTVKVLRGMQVGELAIAALETRGISGLGGLALYIRDIASAFVDLGLDTTIFTWVFARNKDGSRILDSSIQNAHLTYTGRKVVVPFKGESPAEWYASNKGYIYTTMLAGKIKTYAIANERYADVLYSGVTAEDMIRRYRFFSLSFLEAVRRMNVHPSVIHTNEGATGFAIPFLGLPGYEYLSGDPHFSLLRTTLHANHNLDPKYQNIVTADSPMHKDHLMGVAGFDPWRAGDRYLVSPSASSLEINPTYAANLTSSDSATVSPGYRDYTAGSSWGIGLGDVLDKKNKAGRYGGEQNGIDTVDWQKRLLRDATFFECKNREAREDLFERAMAMKKDRKRELQQMAGLDVNPEACVFTMLHRLCEQKGYEIAIDSMREMLIKNKDAQIVVGGPPEDSAQGRDFKRQIDAMASDPRFKGRFKYVGGVSPQTKLYEAMYFGADVFLMPSKFEPAGLSQLEAIGAGTMVVGRSVDGLATSITDVDAAAATGKPATGFTFFDFTSSELEKTMERALAVFRDRNTTSPGKGASLWTQLCYNCFTYDSRWIGPAKRYINNIYGRSSGGDIGRLADAPELLLIFNEAEANEEAWSRPESEESLEKRLIQHGYNTDHGLDNVLSDAVSELKRIADDQNETRPIVKALAGKRYKKYTAVLEDRKRWQDKVVAADSAASSGKFTHDPRVEADIDSMAKLLSDDLLYGKLAEDGIVYEIRYDEDRLSRYPFGVEIIREYAAILKSRAINRRNVILIPSGKMDSLICVRSFSSQDEYNKGRILGEGKVDIRGELNDQCIRLVAMLNMAMAASNIRANTQYKDMEDFERKLIAFIKAECRDITGIDVPEENVLIFIQDLPRAAPLPIESIEEFNRLTIQQLKRAA